MPMVRKPWALRRSPPRLQDGKETSRTTSRKEPRHGGDTRWMTSRPKAIIVRRNGDGSLFNRGWLR